MGEVSKSAKSLVEESDIWLSTTTLWGGLSHTESFNSSSGRTFFNSFSTLKGKLSKISLPISHTTLSSGVIDPSGL